MKNRVGQAKIRPCTSFPARRGRHERKLNHRDAEAKRERGCHERRVLLSRFACARSSAAAARPRWNARKKPFERDARLRPGARYLCASVPLWWIFKAATPHRQRKARAPVQASHCQRAPRDVRNDATEPESAPTVSACEDELMWDRLCARAGAATKGRTFRRPSAAKRRTAGNTWHLRGRCIRRPANSAGRFEPSLRKPGLVGYRTNPLHP